MRYLAVRSVRHLRRALLASVLLLADASGVLAQGSLQIPLQFDFLNPGARSLAVGSAFAGMADDATAGFTNPAGLTILTIPEVSFEVRGRRLESPFLFGGRLSGSVTNIGIDTVPEAIYRDSIAESTGLSYLSIVVPRPRWSIAAYRHELIRLDQQFEAQGVFQGPVFREAALRARREVNITTYGVAGAYRWHPRVSVGGGLTLHQFQLDAQFERFFPDFYDAPTFAPGERLQNAEQHSDEVGIGFNVGTLIRLYEPTGPAGAGPDLVQLGAVYRKGANFDFEGFEGTLSNPTTRNGTFRTPDAFAVGAAVRFIQRATATAEVTWVQYESLLDGYISAQFGNLGKDANFKIDNGVEFHAGFEYLFDARWFPALRVGAWRDPDHAVRYEVPASPDFFDNRFGAYIPARGASMHYTFGGGLALSRRLEANVGVDLSERTRQISVSAVVRPFR